MSVKHTILALLYDEPKHGYEIKTSFEQMMLNQWKLNTGQIYTSLDRMVRDSLVEPLDNQQRDRKKYQITEKGREELHGWLLQPVDQPMLKDTFFLKLLCAINIDFHYEQEMLNKQKARVVKDILHLRKMKNQLNLSNDSNIGYLFEGIILQLEANVRWLEMMLED
jgi:DNA-binding PadR family transcriptional regulator